MNALRILLAVVGVLAAAATAAVVPGAPVEVETLPAALPQGSVTAVAEAELDAVIEYLEQLRRQLLSMQEQAVKQLLQEAPEKRIQTLVALQESMARPANELGEGGDRAVLECSDSVCEEHCRARPGFNAGFCNHYHLCSCYYRPEGLYIGTAVGQ